MAHLNYFGIENFRVFKEKASFDLKPITVLVGTNSSGKSSLIKGLLLLKEMFEKSKNADYRNGIEGLFIFFLDTFGNYGLGNFKSSSNYDGIMAFEFPFSFSVFPQNAILRLEYIQDKTDLKYGKLHRVLILWKESLEPIYEINLSKGQYFNYLHEFYKKFNTYLGDYLKVINLLDKYNENKNNPDLDNFIDNQELLVSELKSIFPSFNSDLNIDFYTQDSNSFTYFKMYHRKYDEIRKFKIGLPLLEYSFFKTDEELISENGEEMFFKIREKEQEFIKNKSIEKDKLVTFLLNMELDHIQKRSPKWMIETLFNIRSGEYGSLHKNNIEFAFDDFLKGSRNESLKFLFENGIINYESNKFGTKNELNLKIFSYYVNKVFESNIARIHSTYNSLYYIPTERSKNERDFNIIKDSDYFTRKLKEFKGKVLNEEAKSFFSTYLKKFEIGDEIEFETSEDSTFVRVYLIIDNKRILLNDNGYGVSQILPILLTIGITLVDNDSDVFQQCARYSSIIVIEEPETNLHPALQSKLADLFIECYEKYDIQFIIETHSEYLIRKLQYLIAKKEFKAEDAVIYNFRKASVDNEEIVKRIDIDKDGGLSADFYPGFFDEALNWELELLKLKRGKSSLN